MNEIKNLKKQYLKKGDLFIKKRRGWKYIEWDIYKQNGGFKCGGSFPTKLCLLRGKIREVSHKKNPRKGCSCLVCRFVDFRTEGEKKRDREELDNAFNELKEFIYWNGFHSDKKPYNENGILHLDELYLREEDSYKDFLSDNGGL